MRKKVGILQMFRSGSRAVGGYTPNSDWDQILLVGDWQESAETLQERGYECLSKAYIDHNNTFLVFEKRVVVTKMEMSMGIMCMARRVRKIQLIVTDNMPTFTAFRAYTECAKFINSTKSDQPLNKAQRVRLSMWFHEHFHTY